MRLSRVSGRLASAIHSTYSFLQLGLKSAKTAAAFLLAFSAFANSGVGFAGGAGAFTTFCRAAIGLVYSPLSMNATACFNTPSISFFGGRSATLVKRPSEPIAPGFRRSIARRTAEISSPQNPQLQCSLNADMLPTIAPLYSKKGRLHFMVSTTVGQALCTNSRISKRIGCAKGLAFAIYASTRGSKEEVGLTVPLQIGMENSVTRLIEHKTGCPILATFLSQGSDSTALFRKYLRIGRNQARL